MQPLEPGSPDWCRVVSASKVAAILSHSPFDSQRSMYHLMRGEYQPPVNEAMERGTFLEDGVLRWWRSRHPEFTQWTDQPQYRLGDWAIATPDGLASGPDVTVIVDAKTSTLDEEWGEPGTDQIPAHYLTSSYWQMHVSGVHEVRLPVLTSRLRFAEYVVLHDVEVGRLLEARCRAFYDSLSADVPPPLDDSLATVECLKQLHPEIDKGEAVEIEPELALAYLTAYADADDAEKRMRAALSELYDRMGRAQYATVNGLKVARRQGSKGNGVTIHKPKGISHYSVQEMVA